MRLNFREFFKALGNENRIKILLLIYQKGVVTPTQIVNRFYLEQPTVARHLATLELAGIITRSRRKPKSLKGGFSRIVECRLNGDFLTQAFMEFLMYLMIQREPDQGDVKRAFLDNFVLTDKQLSPVAMGFINSHDEPTILRLGSQKEAANGGNTN